MGDFWRWNEKVYLYCERGSDPGLWAEPVNVLSNIAFFIAAAAAWLFLLAKPAWERTADHALLIDLVILIGVGSTLFHIFGTAWGKLADVGAITAFMLVYLAVALASFLRLTPGVTIALTAAFAVLSWLATLVRCAPDAIGWVPISLARPLGQGSGVAAMPCLNGTLGYAPALLALLVIGHLLRNRRHPAGLYLLSAGLALFTAMAFRSFDTVLCERIAVAGHDVGTHFAWHILNAVALFLLLKAAIDHSAHGTVQEILPPEPTSGEQEGRAGRDRD